MTVLGFELRAKLGAIRHSMVGKNEVHYMLHINRMGGLGGLFSFIDQIKGCGKAAGSIYTCACYVPFF